MRMEIVFKDEIVAVFMNSELVQNIFKDRRNWSLKETETSFIGVFVNHFGLQVTTSG